MLLKSIFYGLVSALLLLGLYFLILNFVSGWDFTLKEFDDNWYYVVFLSFGFGAQIGLYTYLRCHSVIPARRFEEASPLGGKAGIQKKTWIPDQVGDDGGGKVVAVSGTTSTAAMISCCSHYLVNILPVLGVTGIVTFVSQYQTELFWVGIAANLAGIVYMVRKVLKVRGSIVPPPR